MEYKLRKHEGYSNTWVDQKQQSWPYISSEKMEAIYPGGGYMVVGEIHIKQRKEANDVLMNDGQSIAVSSFSVNLRSNERCIGFIAVESEGEIRFIRLIERKKNKIYWWFLLLFIAAGLIVGGVLLKKEGPNLDESAISYHIEGLKNEDPSNISIPLFGKLKVDGRTMEVEAHLANPQGNPCYFEYRIILKDGNEELYHSKMIEPGTAIPKFVLNKKLKQGSYDGVIVIDTFSLKDHKTQMNGGEMDITLVVEEVK